MEGATPLIPNSIPRLIYGCAQRATSKLVDLPAAMSMGYRAIDTSSHDLCDEEAIGTSLQGLLTSAPPSPSIPTLRFEELTIQAKYSPARFFHTKTPPYNLEDNIPLQVLKSLSTTLGHLQTAYIDVYFLHQPFSTLSRTFAAWEVMEETVRQGGARSLGISQVNLETLQILYEKADVKPAVVQNHFCKHDNYDRGVRRFCKARGICYQGFGVLGALNEDLKGCEAVKEIAEENGLGVEAALIACLLASGRWNGERFCVLDGSRSLDHMAQNLRAVQVADELTEERVRNFMDMTGVGF